CPDGDRAAMAVDANGVEQRPSYEERIVAAAADERSQGLDFELFKALDLRPVPVAHGFDRGDELEPSGCPEGFPEHRLDGGDGRTLLAAAEDLVDRHCLVAVSSVAPVGRCAQTVDLVLL